MKKKVVWRTNRDDIDFSLGMVRPNIFFSGCLLEIENVGVVRLC